MSIKLFHWIPEPQRQQQIDELNKNHVPLKVENAYALMTGQLCVTAYVGDEYVIKFVPKRLAVNIVKRINKRAGEEGKVEFTTLIL